MQKIIYSVGAIAVLAATIFFWSKPVVVGAQTVRASITGAAEATQPSEAAPRISPLEMMVKQGKELPVEEPPSP